MTSRKRVPIACTLTPADQSSQLSEWAELRAVARSVERHGRAVRLEFAIERWSQVEDLGRRESACCAFLTITTEVEDGCVSLTIDSDDPEAEPIIDAIAFGATPPEHARD